MSDPVGSVALVLHAHLPWVAHHGVWPVGEEWLYQAWAGSYLPVFDLLHRLAGEGRTDLLTVGVTPVLASQLDDPYCRNEFSTWLGDWQLRAEELAVSADPQLRALAGTEHLAARHALAAVSGRWSGGLSPVLRPLVDAGAVELLGGPATHPFQPLLPDTLVRLGLQVGLDDTALRIGRRPRGIWSPECGHRPGLEQEYAVAGITHFVVDGPTMRSAGGTVDAGWQVGESDVVAFARDLDVTYRVWSPRKGYPGGRWYRDFHAYDRTSGLRTRRVTNRSTPPDRKAPYDPARAASEVERDAGDFVAVVRKRLLDLSQQRGRPGLVVAAYDLELFGHWWHEGPRWLEAVLRLLPRAGVRVTTLGAAIEDGHVAGRIELGTGSWGSGKDWRVWEGGAVADIVDDNQRLCLRLLKILDSARGRSRDPALEQATRAALLALASDWAFMVTKDSAAQYARDRHTTHHRDFHSLADALESGDRVRATRIAAAQRRTDGPFPALDTRPVSDGGHEHE